MEPSSHGPIIRFRAFGTLELRGPDGTELQSILARPKLLGLLSFLACAQPMGLLRRDTLLGLFWADVDQQRGRRALRQSLYYLRRSLGDGAVIGRGDEEVGLDGEVFWCDVAAFERAQEDDRLEEALELYRGDLLSGLYVSGAPEFDRWLEQRREDLRRQACTAACRLAERLGEAGDVAAAGHWAHSATMLAPFDEAVAARAMSLLDGLGDRSGAVRLYEAFARRLKDELDLDPSPETVGLIRDIRARTEADADRVAARAPASAPEPASPVVQPPEAIDRETVPPVQTSAPRDAIGPSIRRRGFRLGLLAGITTALVIALLWAFRSAEGPALDPQRVLVAVFENQTGEADLDPLGRMAADWITQGLAESGLVEVVPGTLGSPSRPESAAAQAGNTAAIALARTLLAGTIVVGAYYRRGDSVEFQAQILDARNERLLSAVAPAGGSVADPGEAVDSLRQSVVRTLAVVLEPRLSATPAVGHPPPLEAYREYLEGVRAFEERNEMREALEYFYRATALDSTFVSPRFYIVFAHMTLGEWAAADSNARLLDAQRSRLTEYERNTLDWQMARFRGDESAALEAARARGGLDVGVQAVRVNRPREAADALADAEGLADWYFHWLTLMDAYHMLGQYGRELSEARRARAAHPDRLRPLAAELQALAGLGRMADIERALDASLLLPPEESLTPASLMMTAAAELRAHGSRESALEVANRAVEWLLSRPGGEADPPSRAFDLALAYYQAERWEEARRAFEQLASTGPEDVNVLGFLAVLAARRGDRGQALRASEELAGLNSPMDFGRDLYWQACIAAQLGELERAMILLREAYASGRPFSVDLHRDMDLEPLREYPPFQEFIAPRG